eukprot:gene68112-93318_t
MDLLALRPLAEQLFDEVRALSFDGVGVTRESYGRGESATAEYLRDFARAQGLEAEPEHEIRGPVRRRTRPSHGPDRISTRSRRAATSTDWPAWSRACCAWWPASAQATRPR